MDGPAWLIEHQKEAVRLIQRMGGTPLTPSETYAPHLTLARVSKPLELLQIRASFLQPAAFRHAVGLSTENGALTEVL